jgi:hypothetical protein
MSYFGEKKYDRKYCGWWRSSLYNHLSFVSDELARIDIEKKEKVKKKFIKVFFGSEK